MDCLIIMGSFVDTDLANNIISQAISSNTLIIEIAMEPRLEIGNIKQLLGSTQDIVPDLCTKIHDKLLNYHEI